MRTKSYQAGLLAGLLAASFGLGCAQEIGDIDRTQPDRIKKSNLEGEWYFRPTIVDMQYNQGFLFEGLEGDMEKIRWEIQEDVVLGYRSYEANPSIDGEEGTGSEGFDDPGTNTPIVGFAIESHFDIQRQYNPNTGIENNVLEENTTDNPWWEREYMRVDWSTSVVDNPMSVAGFATAYYSDTRAYVSSTWEKDPNRLRISPDYIDFTINMGFFVDMATCYYEFQDYNDWCGASEGKMRMSFRKVDPTNDYELLEYPDVLPVQYRKQFRDSRLGVPCDPGPDNEEYCEYQGNCVPSTTEEEDPFCRPKLYDMYICWESGNAYYGDESFNQDDCNQYTIPVFEQFGYFRNIRYLFDPERGYTLDGRQFLINRWNIWDKSYNADGSLIPAAERKTKKVTYYTSVHFPENLRPAAERFVDQWDNAFRSTVAGLKGLEWDRTDVSTLHAAVPKRIFELKRNSCNPSNIKKYAKDNELEEVVERVAGGMDSIKPGNIQAVCAALEFNSANLDKPFEWQRAGDLRYSMLNWVGTPEVAGPLGYGPSAADPETGEIINANANIYGAALHTWTKRYADIIALMNGDLAESEVEGGEYIREAIENTRNRKSGDLSMAEVNSIMQQVDGAMGGQEPDEYMVPTPPDEYQNRMRSVEQTPLLREYLINDEMLRGLAGPAHYQPGEPVDEEAYKKASPTRWAMSSPPKQFLPNGGRGVDLQSLMGNQRRLTNFFSSRNMYMPEFFNEPAMVGLAFHLKGKSREEVHQHLIDVAFESVAGHEVGHTIGLRHNFQGSGDALNFHPEFWAIKSLDADPATALNGLDDVTWVSADSKANMRQKLTNCSGSGLTTEDCLGLKEYMYSSIMDYGQRLNHDIHGIGLWDYAAIKFGYGQMIEAFDERDGAFVADEYEFNSMMYLLDYKDIPKVVSGVEMEETFWESVNAVSDAETQVVTLPDDIEPAYANIYKRRNVSFEEYIDDYHKDMFVTDYTQQNREVEYSYCSDNFAWGGNLRCNRWDLGANVSEIVQNARELYDNYYLFNNFKNDRFGWGSVYSYLGRIQSRTFTPIKYAFNYYYYYRHSESRKWPMIHDWAGAAFNGLNFLGGILQMPEPGEFCLNETDNIYYRSRGGNCTTSQMTVGAGPGRYYNSRWSQEYFYKPLVIGTFWDKYLVLQTMTDSSAYFYRNYADVFDRGSFSITYYRVFTDEMIELFKGLIDHDISKYAAEVQDVDGKATVVTRRLVGQTASGGDPAPLIQPGENYFFRFWAMYNALFGLTSTVDKKLDMISRARVHLVGEINEPSYDGFAPEELAVYTDPHTGYSYRAAPIDALRDPDTNVIIDTHRCIGYQLVQEAQNYATNVWQPYKDALDAAQDACDDDVECSGTNPDNANWRALLDAENAFSGPDHALVEKTENLDVLRMFVNALPYSYL